MKKYTLSLVALWSLSLCEAQKIHYNVSFPNLAHHEAQIELTATGIPAGPATFRMSRSSPGRYATHEFGKNVYNVAAFDAADKPLELQRIEGDVYQVPLQKGTVKIRYTLFGTFADGTYVGIDPSSIHLNMPASFMWIKGFDKSPIDIKINIPTDKGWKIATQLKPAVDAYTFTAPGLQYFMDAPIKIGDLFIRNWKVPNPDGKAYDFRLALEAKTDDATVDGFVQKIERLVKEEQAVFGEVPAYDYGNYTFLASINPYVDGDGMEHRNSTMITSGNLFTGSERQLGVFAHEFFHCWNVERIRPKTLEPFNFEKANMSHELWMAEGFTQYYGELLMLRAGFNTVEGYAFTLGNLINTKLNSAGGKYYSPVQNSENAVFVDAGVSVDNSNYRNMHSSYYVTGAATALALELELRSKFGLQLDDFMKAVWQKFGKTEIAYDVPGLQAVLASLTKDKKFADDFFARYVTGHEAYDYSAGLLKGGFLLKLTNPGAAWIGNVMMKEKTAQLTNSTVIGSPLYDAGIDIDDVITQLDGQAVKSQSDINDILKNHKPGDQLTIEYKHREETKTANMTLKENPGLRVATFEKEGKEITEEIKKTRDAWLASKVK